jgi:hypothetical protein
MAVVIDTLALDITPATTDPVRKMYVLEQRIFLDIWNSREEGVVEQTNIIAAGDSKKEMADLIPKVTASGVTSSVMWFVVYEFLVGALYGEEYYFAQNGLELSEPLQLNHAPVYLEENANDE